MLLLLLLAVPARGQLLTDADYWWNLAFVPPGSEAREPTESFKAANAMLSLPSLTLSSFAGLPEDGSVRPGTSWDGNVVQGDGFITVGSGAADDNGWGADHVTIDATRFNYVLITAKLNLGNTAQTLSIQFEDWDLTSHVVAVDSSLFSYDEPTAVWVRFGSVAGDFDRAQIESWSIGGGGLTGSMRVSLYDLQLVDVPEPGEYATLLGLAAAGAWYQRRRACRRR